MDTAQKPAAAHGLIERLLIVAEAFRATIGRYFPPVAASPCCVATIYLH